MQHATPLSKTLRPPATSQSVRRDGLWSNSRQASARSSEHGQRRVDDHQDTADHTTLSPPPGRNKDDSELSLTPPAAMQVRVSLRQFGAYSVYVLAQDVALCHLFACHLTYLSRLRRPRRNDKPCCGANQKSLLMLRRCTIFGSQACQTWSFREARAHPGFARDSLPYTLIIASLHPFL